MSTNTSIITITIVCLGLTAFYTKVYRPAIPTIQAEDETPSEITLTNENAFFNSKIFLDRDATFISIPFKFINKPLYIWLYLQPEDDKLPIARLVYHPNFANLTWPVINNQIYSLYQETPVYSSVDDFLANPPRNAKILADPQLAVKLVERGFDATQIRQDSQPEEYQYVITTFRQPRIENGYYVFESLIDATEARTTTSGKNLSWHLQAAGASPENPLILRTIHVDYR